MQECCPPLNILWDSLPRLCWRATLTQAVQARCANSAGILLALCMTCTCEWLSQPIRVSYWERKKRWACFGEGVGNMPSASFAERFPTAQMWSCWDSIAIKPHRRAEWGECTCLLHSATMQEAWWAIMLEVLFSWQKVPIFVEQNCKFHGATLGLINTYLHTQYQPNKTL